jgi:signal peptidase II
VKTKTAWFWPLLFSVALTDWFTKRLAVEHLQPAHVPHEIVGDILRFTLAYNPGAAFSMSLGEYSRVGFSVLAMIVLGVLFKLYRETEAADRWQGAALGLVAGGAIGNLADRLTSPRGVVDFIDVGLDQIRFWTFNVADMGVTCGAVLLGILILRRGGEPQAAITHSPP